MSDAIEVLKDLKRQYSDYCNEYQLEDDNKFIDTLDEALLALEFFNWIKEQKKKCEKDLMLYGDYYNKMLLVETVYQWYKEELEEGSAKTKGFLESPRKKLGDVEK